MTATRSAERLSGRDSVGMGRLDAACALPVLRTWAAAAILCSVLTSCTREEMTNTETQSTSAPKGGVAREPDLNSSWRTFATTPVYFGHQSVGGNIVDGLREMSDSATGPPLTIVRSRERSSGRAGTLVEFPIGENGLPESKLADFAVALDEIGDTGEAVAVFKYCYLDITAETNVQALFARHRDAVRAMRVKHPNLTFVHVTAPLTAVESGPRYIAKRLLGKSTMRDSNARRNAFNALLRSAYAGEPIFDLARIESTRPDGSRSFFRAGTDTVHTLAPELTDDGGHLNSTGRSMAAREFVAVVARAVDARRIAAPNAAR